MSEKLYFIEVRTHYSEMIVDLTENTVAFPGTSKHTTWVKASSDSEAVEKGRQMFESAFELLKNSITSVTAFEEDFAREHKSDLVNITPEYIED